MKSLKIVSRENAKTRRRTDPSWRKDFAGVTAQPR
jgi:hypothetical protein